MSVERDDKPAPKWFVFVRAYATAAAVAIALAAGYGSGHVVIGALIALGYFIGDFVFMRWVRARHGQLRERLADPEYRQRYQERSDRLARVFGWYFAAVGGLLILAVVALFVAKLA